MGSERGDNESAELTGGAQRNQPGKDRLGQG